MIEPITPTPQTTAIPSRDVALGEPLFRDPCLSSDGCLSCSSCHDTTTNGANGRAFNFDDDRTRLPVTTNMVFNAVRSSRPNRKNNARMLAERARTSLFAPAIMGATPATMRSLAADPAPDRRFREVYDRPPYMRGFIDVLANFEATLITPDGRFDLHLRSNSAALGPGEQVSYAAFKAVAYVACRQGVNVGRNLLQRNGIFSLVAGSDLIVLRVPSLSNVATTPYFHSGNAPTLAAAMSDMARAQLGRELSFDQTVAIVAFLRKLTCRYKGIPVKEAW